MVTHHFNPLTQLIYRDDKPVPWEEVYAALDLYGEWVEDGCFRCPDCGGPLVKHELEDDYMGLDVWFQCQFCSADWDRKDLQ